MEQGESIQLSENEYKARIRADRIIGIEHERKMLRPGRLATPLMRYVGELTKLETQETP